MVWFRVMKATIAFRDAGLYRAIRMRAVAENRPIRDIVEEALAAWLERQEDAEDAAASGSALEEYETAGGVQADAFFRRMVAERRVTYETDPER
jgi:hypothetical protein